MAVVGDEDSKENLTTNPTVLQLLFRHYISEVLLLARCRLVCKSWNVEACTELRRNAIIPLYFSNHNSQRYPRRFIDVMGKSWDLPFQKFSISMVDIEHPDVQEFFENFGDLITLLKLRIDGGSNNNDPASFKKLLLYQLPNLKELQIFGLPERISKQEELFNETSPILAQLDSLTLWRTPGEDNDQSRPSPGSLNSGRSYKPTPLYFNILKYAKSLNTFRTNNVNSFLELLSNEEYLYGFKSVNLNTVKSFQMNFPLMDATRGMGLPNHHVFLESNYISALPILCPKLKSLSLYLARFMSSENVSMLLKKSGETLEELRIYKPREFQDLRVAPNNQLKIPLMRNLKKLTLEYTDWIFAPCNFPKLSFLSLSSWTIFFPEIESRKNVATTLPTLTTLKIQPSKILPLTKGLTAAKMESLVSLFPNLKILHFPATDDSLHIVYKKLPYLEELSITNSNIWNILGEDVFPELTDEGITGMHMRTCAKILKDKKYDDVKSEVWRTRPYIGDLKNLKRFWTKGTLTNVSIRYGLADVKELTNLFFYHSQSPRKVPWCVCPSKSGESRNMPSSSRRTNANRTDNDGEAISLKPLADNLSALVKIQIKSCYLSSDKAVNEEDVAYIKSKLPNLELIIDDSVDEFFEN